MSSTQPHCQLSLQMQHWQHSLYCCFSHRLQKKAAALSCLWQLVLAGTRSDVSQTLSRTVSPAQEAVAVQRSAPFVEQQDYNRRFNQFVLIMHDVQPKAVFSPSWGQTSIAIILHWQSPSSIFNGDLKKKEQLSAQGLHLFLLHPGSTSTVKIPISS